MTLHVIYFDTETTSAEPETTRVVQFAAMIVNTVTNHTETINTLLNPEAAISEEAQKIHGISKEMVENEPVDRSFFSTLTEEIEERMAKGDTFVLAGQNSIGFDAFILDRLVKESRDIQGYEDCESDTIWKLLPHIDTYIAAVRLFPRLENHQLSTLAQHFGFASKEDIEQNAHDAMYDIRMVREVLEYLKEAYLIKEDDVNDGNYLELAAWIAKPKIWERIPFGMHKGKLFGRGKYGDRHLYVPSFYINFIVDKFTNPLPDLVLTIRHFYGKEFRQ